MDELLKRRAQFLAFLKKRLRREDLAEEILQAAYLKSLQASSALRKHESIVAWFYRLLRNAVTDLHRRDRAGRQALAAAARREVEDPELRKTVCRCVTALIPGIKPEYGEVLSRVDVEGGGVQEVAVRLGMSANNASVRLHRARKALRDRLIQVCGACASHGCVDCECKETA